jgi:hypothetical protein
MYPVLQGHEKSVKFNILVVGQVKHDTFVVEEQVKQV